MSRPLSRNARSDTPLARRYREARAAYKKAGKALRASCSAKSRSCGQPKAFPRKGPRVKYVAASAKAMKAEFLRTAVGEDTNEDIIRSQVGHLNVKDTTQWEPIAEKFETGPLETFDQAFGILTREAARGRRNTRGGNKPDWRRLDIDVLRSCPGLEGLQLPTWMNEAKTADEQHAAFNEIPF